MTFKTIGIIGGTGWIGRAIARNLLLKKFISPAQLWISNRSGTRSGFEHWPDVQFTTEPQQLVEQCDLIILSVLPAQLPNLRLDATNKLIISVMAGVTLDQLEQSTRAAQIIRCMPNAAAEIGQSYTPWCANAAFDTNLHDGIEQLLQTFGTCEKLASEDALNYFTALTGSGHGTLAYLQQAMIEAACKHAIDPHLARRAVAQLFTGVSQLIAHETRTPAQTVQVLTEYAGTTAALLNSLAAANVATALRQSIDAAYVKAASNMTTQVKN